MEQNDPLSLPGCSIAMHEKHRERQSRCEHHEIHLLADDTYEGERQDCYKQGA
jgi:hypothetical protein